MNTNLAVELLEVPMDQLSSPCEMSESPLDMIYLTQQRLAHHYCVNPEIMNTILIPVKRINSPMPSLGRVAPRRHYEVLGNYHIFFALKKAQCPLARCLCLNRSEEKPEIWQTELQTQSGRPNITSMNQEELQQAFDYLVRRELGKREKILLKLLSHKGLAQALANDSSRPYWRSWQPLKALAKTLVSSKIDKKHTERLDQYFRIDQPSKLCINTASAEELSRYIQSLLFDLDARQKVLHKLLSHEELIPTLVKDSTRPHWSSWKRFIILAKTLVAPSKIEKTHTGRLDQYFCFIPEPPLITNTVSYHSSR